MTTTEEPKKRIRSLQALSWNKNNPESRKKSQEKYRQTDKYRYSYVSSHLKRTYGITYENYLEIYKSQGEVCAICGRTELRRSYENKREQLLPLFVDHCHTSGVVRGLLCSKCNTGLGMFEDNKQSLSKAISYLKGYSFGND